jgi:hypothetical protein
MRTVATGLLAFLLYFGYWVWASILVVSALVAWGASEEPPYTEEGNLFWLAVVGWVAATLVGIGLTVSMRRSLIAALWLGGLLVSLVPFGSTVEAGGVRIAPSFIVVGLMAELAGLVAILLSRSLR